MIEIINNILMIISSLIRISGVTDQDGILNNEYLKCIAYMYVTGEDK